MQERSQGTQAMLQGLGFAESLVTAFEQSAKFYWRAWGPLGEPMFEATEQWANMQRRYLTALQREAPAATPRGTAAAEGSARADEEGPSEDVRSTIRDSVRRSEEGGGEEPQAGATAVQAVPFASPALEESRAADAEGLPIEDYDSLNVKQVSQRLEELSFEELERLRDYEAENKNRRSLMERFERRIRAAREDLGGNGEAEERPEEEIRSIIRESMNRSAGEE